MKTIKNILIATLAFFAVSCQGNLSFDQADAAIFTASIENPISKVAMGNPYIGEDNKTHYPMLWYGLEKITVFGTDGQNYQFDGDARDAEQKPVYMSTVDFKHQGKTFELVEGETYYAVEPYHNSHTIDKDEKITVRTIANSQYPDPNNGNLPCISYTNGTYGETAMVALAKTTNKYLSFKPVTALIKFTVGSDNVTRVVFKDKNNTTIAGGSITFDYTGDYPSLSSIGSTNNAIYLRMGDNSAFIKGNTYYMAVLPTKITPAIGFNFNGATEGTKYKTGPEEIELKPGMILNLGTITIIE